MSNPLLSKCDSLPSHFRNCKIVSQVATRLGGQLTHLLAKSGDQYFLKMGSGLERSELIRQDRNIRALQQLIAVPQIEYFAADCSQAVLVTKRVQGQPLHELIGRLDCSQLTSLLKSILNQLWSVDSKGLVPAGVDEEVTEVENLIRMDKLNLTQFMERSGGQKPQAVLDEIASQLQHSSKDVLTHGDFCLPNIFGRTRWLLGAD